MEPLVIRPNSSKAVPDKSSYYGPDGPFHSTTPKSVSDYVAWVTKVKPPKTKHFVRGVWLARPYELSIAYQHLIDEGKYCYRTSHSGSPTGKVYHRRDSNYILPDILQDGSGGLGQTSNKAILDQLDQELRLKAVLTLNRGDINVGVALAESKRTLLHLATTAVTASRWLKLASKGRWRSLSRETGIRPGRIGRTTAERWLEYQYAWRPLLGDMFGAMSELKKSILEKDQVITNTVSRSQTRSLSDWIPRYVGGSPNTNLTPDSGHSIPRKVELGVTVNIVARVDSPTVAKLSSLGLLNPAAVAWELVPWSFVVDWFVPIGSFLESFTASAGLSFVTGSSTRVVRSQIGPAKLPRNHLSAPSALILETPAYGETASLNMKRTVLSSFPSPAIVLRQNPFTSTRVANAIALLRTNLGQVDRNRR